MAKKQTCKGKRWYLTAAEAEAVRARQAAEAKRAGDRSADRLVVYRCRECRLFHIGHVRPSYNQTPPPPKPAPPKAKQLTHGEARRTLARLDRAHDRHNDWYHRRMAEILGRVIAADRACGDID